MQFFFSNTHRYSSIFCTAPKFQTISFYKTELSQNSEHITQREKIPWCICTVIFLVGKKIRKKYFCNREEMYLAL